MAGAGEGEFLNEALARELAAGEADLRAVADDAAHELGVGHLNFADVVADFLTVLEGERLGLPARVVDGDFQRVFLVLPIREGPAADVAEDVQLLRREADLGLDGFGEGALRVAVGRAAFEHHDVLRQLGGVNDVEGHSVGVHRAGLRQRQGAFVRQRAGVEPIARAGGVSAAEVNEAEARLRADDERQQVAQALRAERLEALGHERATGVLAAFDVGFLNFLLARGVLEDDHGLVLAHHDAVGQLAVLRLDADGDVGDVHFLVRVENLAEQFRRAVRAHASEVGTDVVAERAEEMAGGAVHREELLALRGVAGLRDLGRELRDERVLRLRFRPAQLVHQVIRTLRDGGVGVDAEAMNVRRAEDGGRNHVGLQRGEQCGGPSGALEKLIERGGLRFAGEFRQRLG